MNKKATISKIHYILLLLFICIIFWINLNGLYQENKDQIIIGLLLNLLLFGMTIMYFKIDYVSFLILCIQALLIPVSIQYFTDQSYGALSMHLVPLHIAEFITFTFVYCSFFIALAIIFNFKKSEINIVNVENKSFGTLNIVLNNLIAIVFSIVAFPRLSLTTLSGTRFDMLLPGHAWNQLAIVALIFNYPYLKRVSVKMTYLFVILWFLLNGERADITGLILGLIVLKFMKDKKRSTRSYIFLVISSILFLILLNTIAIIRSNQKVMITTAIDSLLTTPTTSDVSYLFTASIDAWKNNVCLHSQMFKSDFLSIIPFSNPNGFESIIRQLGYFSPGGEPFLAQPILDWGVVGLVIRPIIDFSIFKLLTVKVTSFFNYEFITLLCLVPRMVWYGRNYVFSSLIFFVPILYIVNYYLLKEHGDNI